MSDEPPVNTPTTNETAERVASIPSEVTFCYEKSNFFRTIHVDGAHGGISPDGHMVIMSVFNERRPIPKKEVYRQDQSGIMKVHAPGTEVRDGYFREVEATLIMDEETVRTLHKWLEERLRDLQSVKEFRRRQELEPGTTPNP